MSTSGQEPNYGVDTKPEDTINRREFFSTALAALGITFAGGTGLYGIGRYLIPPKKPERYRDVLIASLDEVPEGKTFEFKDLDGRKAMLVNLGDSKYKAFSAVCTHLGCMIKWVPGEKVFHCPCHDGYFDSSGSVISGPPPRPLDEFKVTVKEDKFLYVTFRV